MFECMTTMLRLARLALVIAVAVAAAGGGPDAAEAGQGPAAGVPAYELDPSFPPALPNGWVMGVPTSVAVDARDHVWVLSRPRTVPEEQSANAAPAVMEFDASGAFVQGWGGPAEGYDWPDTEHGIFVDHQDHVWITGINPRAGNNVSDRADDMILKFTRDGEFLFQKGSYGVSGGNVDTDNPRQPADVSVYGPRPTRRSSRTATATAGCGCSTRTAAPTSVSGAPFGSEPEDAYEIGVARPAPAPREDPLVTTGTGPEQFGIVHGLGVSSDGHVYVADRGNRRIQVFTVAGDYVMQGFVNRSGPGPSTVARIAFSPDPEQRLIYANDFNNGKVWLIDRQTLETVGEFGAPGSEPGQLTNLHHIAVDSRGNVFGAEVGRNRRVQKFRIAGN